MLLIIIFTLTRPRLQSPNSFRTFFCLSFSNGLNCGILLCDSHKPHRKSKKILNRKKKKAWNLTSTLISPLSIPLLGSLEVAQKNGHNRKHVNGMFAHRPFSEISSRPSWLTEAQPKRPCSSALWWRASVSKMQNGPGTLGPAYQAQRRHQRWANIWNLTGIMAAVHQWGFAETSCWLNFSGRLVVLRFYLGQVKQTRNELSDLRM